MYVTYQLGLCSDDISYYMRYICVKCGIISHRNSIFYVFEYSALHILQGAKNLQYLIIIIIIIMRQLIRRRTCP